MSHHQTPPAIEARKPWRSGHPKIRAAQERVAKTLAAPPFECEAFEAMLKTLGEVHRRALRAHDQELAEHRWAKLGAQ